MLMNSIDLALHVIIFMFMLSAYSALVSCVYSMRPGLQLYSILFFNLLYSSDKTLLSLPLLSSPLLTYLFLSAIFTFFLFSLFLSFPFRQGVSLSPSMRAMMQVPMPRPRGMVLAAMSAVTLTVPLSHSYRSYSFI